MQQELLDKTEKLKKKKTRDKNLGNKMKSFLLKRRSVSGVWNSEIKITEDNRDLQVQGDIIAEELTQVDPQVFCFQWVTIAREKTVLRTV